MSRSRSALAVSTAVVALIAVACSSSDDEGSTDGSQVDRAAVNASLLEIADDALDGGSAAQGVTLEDNCPPLGDASVADVVSDADIGLDIDDDRSSGYLHSIGDGLSVQCGGSGDDASVSIIVQQSPALDAAEFVKFAADDDDVVWDLNVEHPAFANGSLVVRQSDSTEAVAWIDNSLFISVGMGDGNENASRDDSLAVLAATRDQVLKTLQGSTDGSGDGTGDEGDIDRAETLEALLEAMPDETARIPQSLDGGPCPFLSEAGFDSLTQDLDWNVDGSNVTGLYTPSSFSISCNWGDAAGNRTISVAFSRPVSVDEYREFHHGPLVETAWTVEELESSETLLKDRSFVLDQDGNRAGWINNGLVIIVSLDDDDAEETLASVIPAVLAELGIDAARR